MAGQPAREIQQSKPFILLEEEAFLNLGKTFEVLQQKVATFLKTYQLTPPQYNLLRILRGAGPEGVTCSQACERMITSDPDITRLLDRLESRKLIQRERSHEDRRVVITKSTADGLALLNEIDAPLASLLRKTVGHVGAAKLNSLIDTLESLREGRP